MKAVTKPLVLDKIIAAIVCGIVSPAGSVKLSAVLCGEKYDIDRDVHIVIIPRPGFAGVFQIGGLMPNVIKISPPALEKNTPTLSREKGGGPFMCPIRADRCAKEGGSALRLTHTGRRLIIDHEVVSQRSDS